MTASYAQVAAHNDVIRAALRCVAADYYADDADPHADAESEYAGEQLALAARELVRAVDALPEDQQPIGWNTEPAASTAVLASRDLLTAMGGLADCTVIPFGGPIPNHEGGK